MDPDLKYKKRERFSNEVTLKLEDWANKHGTTTCLKNVRLKNEILEDTSLSAIQISRWFRNKRYFVARKDRMNAFQKSILLHHLKHYEKPNHDEIEHLVLVSSLKKSQIANWYKSKRFNSKSAKKTS